jgi:hypothetical protein
MQQTVQTSEPTSDNSIISRRPPTLVFSYRTQNICAKEPGQRELFLIAGVSCLVFIAVISVFKNYFQAVNDFGDNSAYIAVASAIRHWDFRGLTIKQFWGLPYLMALVSFVSHASDRSALLVISLGSYFISIALAYRLWGGWVAGFFAVVSFDWFQRAFLGGSEPLFLGLLFSSFLVARRNRWISAALLASLSTVVRPFRAFRLGGNCNCFDRAP